MSVFLVNFSLNKLLERILKHFGILFEMFFYTFTKRNRNDDKKLLLYYNFTGFILFFEPLRSRDEATAKTARDRYNRGFKHVPKSRE